jgi:hypothetical protein
MDFIKTIRKNTKSNSTNVVLSEDLDLVMKDNIEDWKEMMLSRSMEGYDHVYIWEFDEKEIVYILKRDDKISYDIDKPRTFSSGTEVLRSYSSGKFFNSSDFRDWILDIFPSCTTTLEYRGKRGYFVRLNW